MKNVQQLKELVILDTDAEQLKKLLQSQTGSNQYCSALNEEIQKARIVTRDKLPDDVIVMNSTIKIQDLDNDDTDEYMLVYPSEADIDLSKISILAPIGTAMIGYRKNDVIQWKVPGGIRSLKISSVTQPSITAE